MLAQPIFERTDVSDIVHQNPWVSLVSAKRGAGLVVSHLPVIVDRTGDGWAVAGHMAKVDAEEHELGEHDVVIIAEGPQGYVSPSWYRAGPYVPTWNFVVAHLYGRPTILDDAETFDVLDRTVDHFESSRTHPWHLAEVDAYARRIAPGVTGFRLEPTRFVGKAKLSQDKPQDVALRVIDALENPRDEHHNAALAAAMRAALVAGA